MVNEKLLESEMSKVKTKEEEFEYLLKEDS